MKIKILLCLVACCIVHSICPAEDERPNIILIMADDVGYSDIGCFGGEIDTPNLDKLGFEGMRFSNGYNMAKCNPTRSSMMTGTFWGNERAQSMGALMTKAGYTTISAGKEHYDSWVPKRCKAMHSFEHSFIHYGGMGNFFDYNPVTFHLNEKQLHFDEIENETEPYYKTNVITDYALRFLDETKDDKKPFFLYLAYESAHYPLQALKEDYLKYKGKYLVGWDKIREQRFRKQAELGILDDNTKLSAPETLRSDSLGGEYVPWTEIPENDKGLLDTRMAAFAAMVHCFDRNIGRVVSKVEAMGELENTLIIFLSDNGSCPFIREKKTHLSMDPTNPESFLCLDARWANAGNTPFRYFKQNGYEGGAKTHLIAHWPKVIKPGSIYREPAHIVDFLPTFLELGKGEYPELQDGKPTPKLDGMSLLPVFKGQEREAHPILLSGWQERKRMVRQGEWKINKSMKTERWELYNMKEDPSEMIDLAKQKPAKVKELLGLYRAWLKDRDVSLDNGNRKNKKKRSS